MSSIGLRQPHVNDVIAVSNDRYCFVTKRRRLPGAKSAHNQLRTRVDGFMAIEVPAGEVSALSDAVATYLFNSRC